MKDSLLIQPAKLAVSNTNARDAQQAKPVDRRDIPEHINKDDDYGTSHKKDDFFKQFENSHAQALRDTNNETANNSHKDAGTLSGEILSADLTIEADSSKSPPSDLLGLNTIKATQDAVLDTPPVEFNTPQSVTDVENITTTELAALDDILQSETQTSLHSEVSLFNYDTQTLTAEEAAQIAAIENFQEAGILTDSAAFRTLSNIQFADGEESALPKAPLGNGTEIASFLNTIKGQIPVQTQEGTQDNNAHEISSDTESLISIEELNELTAEIASLDLDAINIDDVEIDFGDLQFQRQVLNKGPVMQTALENLMANNLNMGLSLNSEAGTLRPIATITMPPSSPSSPTGQATAIVNTVAQAILTAKETPQGVMVRLDPPEMGRVLIDFSFENDSQVNVVVKADNVDSHQLLRDRSEHFLQMLQDNGFENVNLSFEQESFDGFNQNPDNDNRPQSVVYYDAPIIEKLDPENQAEIRRQIHQGKLRLDLKL